MNCPKSLKMAHEEVQQKLFAMLPEKWDRIYLYASIIDHFNSLQTGEMFFFYYPKGVLKKRPINVYEVPVKFNIDEKQYFSMADDLYASLKKLRKECIQNNEKPWTNLTISIEKLKYKVEYSYEELKASEYDSNARHIIWAYKYLETPYESLNRKERKIIDEYIKSEKEPVKVFMLPLYEKGDTNGLKIIKQAEKSLTYVTDETIKEMEFRNTHVPKSQILNSK